MMVVAGIIVTTVEVDAVILVIRRVAAVEVTTLIVVRRPMACGVALVTVPRTVRLGGQDRQRADRNQRTNAKKYRSHG
jgi:hypothetical protein